MVDIPVRYWQSSWTAFSDFTVPGGSPLLGAANESPNGSSGTWAAITSTASSTIVRRVRPGGVDTASVPAVNAAASNRGLRDQTYSHTTTQPDGFPSQKDFPCKITGTWTFNLYLAFATGSTAVQYALGTGINFTFIVYAINASNVSRELFRFTTANVAGTNIGATDATPTLNAFTNNPGTLDLNANEILQYEIYCSFNAGLTATTVDIRYGGGAPSNNNTNLDGPNIAAFPVKNLAGTVTPGPSVIKNTIVKYLAGSMAPTGAIKKTALKNSLAGSLAPTGALKKTALKFFTGTQGSSGALKKTPQKTLSGAVAPTPGVLQKTAVKSLAGTQGSSGALKKTVLKNLAGTITSSAVLKKTIVKYFRGFLYGPAGSGGPVVTDSGDTYVFDD